MSSPQTVTIDGRDFALDSLSDAAREHLANVQMASQEIARLQRQLAISQTARNAYAQALQRELPSLEEQAFDTL